MYSTMWALGVLLFAACCAAAEDPYVRIPHGLMKGKWSTSRGGKQFMAFHSIPYAAPPVGDLRFEPPQQPNSWDGVLDATIPKGICMQKNFFIRDKYNLEGEEDCLYMNVYTNKVNASDSDLLPVMVFIHGGAFVTGSALFYTPEYFMDKDIVLVAFSYRLGPLGFLSMEDDDLPGNLGLKDQSFALKWVQGNVKFFGGNPESVTIFGESAGSASVHFQMLSPMSRGLFHRAILQSATALCPWALAAPGANRKNSMKLAELVNCPSSPTKEMVKCLKGKPAADIINTDTAFLVWSVYPILSFMPVIEKLSDASAAFLPQCPGSIIREGKAAQVPVMMGITSEEGAMGASGIFGEEKLITELDRDFNKIAPTVFLLEESTGMDVKEVTQQVRRFYFGGKAINHETVSGVVDLFSDSWFVAGIDNTLRLMKKFHNQPIYHYLLSYRGSRSFSSLFGNFQGDLGVCHADDLLYLFPLNSFPFGNATEEDEKYSKIFIEMWTNFATTGNPTPELNDLIKTKWKPVSTENFEYYNIGKTIAMEENMMQTRKAFWSLLTNSHRPGTRDEL